MCESNIKEVNQVEYSLIKNGKECKGYICIWNNQDSWIDDLD